MMMRSTKGLGVALTLLATGSLPAIGQIAVSANDGKSILDNGVTKVSAGVPDTVAILGRADPAIARTGRAVSQRGRL